MTFDFDIYRAANLLVKQHGEDAPIEAAGRAVRRAMNKLQDGR